MWKDLLALVQQVVTLAKDMERMREDNKETKQQLLNLTLQVQRLSDELVMNKQYLSDQIILGKYQQQAAHDNLKLQLEVDQLKFKAALPPGKGES